MSPISSGAVTQISSAVSWSATTRRFHINISSAVSWSATMWHFHILCLLALAIAAAIAKRHPCGSRMVPCGSDDPEGYHDLPAESGAEGSYDMSTKKEKVFGRPRLATGFSSGGVHRCGRWIASVVNDFRRWQLRINNSWTTSHHEDDAYVDTRHSHSWRDNLQRIVCRGGMDDGRPLWNCEVCDAPTENRPCPICKIPICDCCRLRGAPCMCGESCELPEQQVKTVVMISRSSQCDLRSDRFGACCSSITGSSLCKVCDGGSDVGSSDADRGTTLQSDSFEETSEASVANNQGDAIDPEYELDSVDLFPFVTFFDGACGEPSVAVGGVSEFHGGGNFEACGAEISIGCVPGRVR